jgi:hypothetical protein
MRFWLPWWLFPVYAAVWLVFLPFRLIFEMIFGKPRRHVERPSTRVTIRIKDAEKPPPSHYG